jgi:hypothetical protein
MPEQKPRVTLWRKKPVVVEAHQWFSGESVPGVCRCFTPEFDNAPHVHTIHQDQAVRLCDGDYIIPEGDGFHYYPVKPDIFKATYEPVER